MPFEGTWEECLDRLAGDVRKFWQAFKEEYRKQAEIDAAQVERDAILEAPIGKKKSGAKAAGKHMVHDITHRIEETEEDIIAKVGVPKEAPSGEYVAFVNFGTGRRGAISAAFLRLKVPEDYYHPKYHDYNPNWPGMAANPFLFRALNMNKARIAAGRRKALRAALQRVRGRGG